MGPFVNLFVRLANCRESGFRHVAQLVEHYLDTVGVVGSSPIVPTILFFAGMLQKFFVMNRRTNTRFLF